MCALLQILGGVSILIGINQDLGTFRNHGLLTLVANWFRSCPLFKKPKSTGAAPSILGTATVSATGRVTKECTSLEEEIEEIKRQIEECRNLVYEKEKLQNERLENFRKQMHSSISGVEGRLNKLSSQVEEVTLGGISSQFFGFILLLYAAVLGIFV